MRAWEASLLAGALLFVSVPAVAVDAGLGTMTMVDWGTREALGDTVLEVTFELSQAAECSVQARMGGSVDEHGAPLQFVYLEGPDGVIGSGVISVFRSQSAHVGDVVDTREPIEVTEDTTLFPAGSWGATTTMTGPMPAGTLVLTMGGNDLHSTNDDPTRSGYQSLGYTIDCPDPVVVTVTGLRGSHELLLFSGRSMEGGVGVFVSLVASASVGDSVGHVFEASEVHSRVSWRNYQDPAQVGTLVRTTPAATTTYDLSEPGEHRIRDVTGAGMHRYELDRVALDFFSTLTGVVYGLDTLAAPGELLP